MTERFSVVCIARNFKTLEPLVVYRDADNEGEWVCTIEEWFDEVLSGTSRIPTLLVPIPVEQRELRNDAGE